MLVIGRKQDESIRIFTTAGDIVITVTRIEDGKVRLGFKAPESVVILRQEIVEQEIIKGRDK